MLSLKKKFIPIFFALGVLLMLFVLSLVYKRPEATPLSVNPTLGTRVEYFCAEGRVQAIYTTESLKLSLPDGRRLILPQTVSASGARYEHEGLVFWSKGDEAFISENDQQIFSDCVAGTLRRASKEDVLFLARGGRLSVVYPKEFLLSGGGIGFTEGWKQHSSTVTTGTLFLHIKTPGNFRPGTNLREVLFTVGASTSSEALRECLTAEKGGEKGVSLTLNKKPFTRFVSRDAGAGNFYETVSYRTLEDDACYAIEYTMHSLNIFNFPKESGIREFNKEEIENIFDAIVESVVIR